MPKTLTVPRTTYPRLTGRIRSNVLQIASLALFGVYPGWTADGSGPACQAVAVEDDASPPVRGVNAEEIAQKLDKAAPDTSVRVLNPSLLWICADAPTADELKKTVRLLSSAHKPRPALSDAYSVRLYFNRSAGDMAKLLSAMYPDNKIQALGGDLLVFQSSDSSVATDIRRWIALIDAPRPEIAANVWSVQISSQDEKEVQKIAERIRSTVSRYNDELQRSLERGWFYLGSLDASKDLDNYFARYVVSRYSKHADSRNRTNECGPEGYCLGYGDSFYEFLQPKLTSMIGVLAAANSLEIVTKFVNAMESGSGGTLAAGGNCEELDAQMDGTPHAAPRFACFRQQLTESLQARHKGLLRKAIADFLFQYKFSVEYRHSFEPYDYVSSAQDLDTQLDPLLVAFNRDVTVYLNTLQNEVQHLQDKGKKIDFVSNGIVTLRTISGTDSEVDTTTQNKFVNTPPPLVQDFVKQFTAAQANVPELFKSNLPTNAATALAAFLNSGQSTSVTLGRDLTLKMTPISLQGGGAAELKIHLDAKDDGKPQQVAPDGSTKDDTTDRVAQHTIDTNVRVDSLKLFEVSSFSAALSRGREPIPLLLPFVELPYIGSLVKLPRAPSTVYHRSLAIISAIVVPTAADLLNAMRYQRDTDEQNQRMIQSPESAPFFHRAMLHCIAQEAAGESGASDFCGHVAASQASATQATQ